MKSIGILIVTIFGLFWEVSIGFALECQPGRGTDKSRVNSCLKNSPPQAGNASELKVFGLYYRSLYPLVKIVDGKFVKIKSNEEALAGPKLYHIREKRWIPVECQINWDELNRACKYNVYLKDMPRRPFSLVVNQKDAQIRARPTKKQGEEFKAIAKSIKSKKVKPLGISDLNKNEMFEYWYVVGSKESDEFFVSEMNPKTQKFKVITSWSN